MKKILTSCLVVFLCLTAFLSAYSKGCYSYAEDINYMSDEDLEAAYQAYLQSKSGGLLGNAGARLTYMNGKLLNFMTSSSNNTGISTIDMLKGEMSWQKTQLENGQDILSLGITNRGLGFLNLYTQWLLQNHYFGNNASLDNNGMFEDGTEDTLYSGRYFIDADGIGCMMYIKSGTSWNTGEITANGTDYKYTFDDILSISQNGNMLTFNCTESKTIVETVKYWEITYNSRPKLIINSNLTNQSISPTYYTNQYVTDKYYHDIYKATPIVVYQPENDKIYLMRYKFWYRDDVFKNASLEYVGEITNVPSENNQNVNIIFYTNNNNNVLVYPNIDANGTLYITPKVDVGVNGEVNYQPYTINQGDTISNVVNNYYIDSGTKDKTITIPSDNPNTGGNGSGGNTDNPSGGTPPNWNNPYPNITQGSDGVFNFNFHLPDLNIDWNINGLKEKFPFSIPFDLIRFISVLNAEPETPEFDFTIDLRIYQWHIDADLHAFDNLASIVRNVEFIGFCITLVLITRRMIKG